MCFVLRVLTNHSKEVSEMDGILNEQIQEVYVQQQAKVMITIITVCLFVCLFMFCLFVILVTANI